MENAHYVMERFQCATIFIHLFTKWHCKKALEDIYYSEETCKIIKIFKIRITIPTSWYHKYMYKQNPVFPAIQNSPNHTVMFLLCCLPVHHIGLSAILDLWCLSICEPQIKSVLHCSWQCPVQSFHTPTIKYKVSISLFSSISTVYTNINIWEMRFLLSYSICLSLKV